MSFNPVGSWVPPAAQEEPVGAFVVSKSKRIREAELEVLSWWAHANGVE